MTKHRRGFSALELMVVVVVLGVLAALTAPRLSGAASSMAVRAARQDVAAALVGARSAAIHNGRSTSFVRSGGTITVFIDSSGTDVPLSTPRDLAALHQVEVEASRNVIRFDPRGIAVGLSAIETIIVSRNGARDSVCVLRLGKVSRKDCTP